MAWKPWYERMAEIESAEERAEFARGVFNAPKPMSGTQVAGMALTALMVGWGSYALTKGSKK